MLGLGFFSGCATTGPNHVYVTTVGDLLVHDLGGAPAVLQHGIRSGESVLGLAYDFNTDHVFLRIAPQQVIREMERPSGKVFGEMPLPAGLKTDRSADLAIRSRDRHLFAVWPGGRAVAELGRWGEFIRRIPVTGLDRPLAGLAYDQKRDRLLVLLPSAPARLGWISSDGAYHELARLGAPVDPVSLGFDSNAQHSFVPLADGHRLGEFDATGQLVATLPVSADHTITAVDAGERSFFRMF